MINLPGETKNSSTGVAYDFTSLRLPMSFDFELDSIIRVFIAAHFVGALDVTLQLDPFHSRSQLWNSIPATLAAILPNECVLCERILN